MARPVIATSVGPLPENVAAPPRIRDELRTGWVVPPDDPVELARAIATALALDAAGLPRAGRARAAVRRVHVLAAPGRPPPRSRSTRRCWRSRIEPPGAPAGPPIARFRRVYLRSGVDLLPVCPDS